MAQPEWEPVTSGTHPTLRLIVPGGWLYRQAGADSSVFVPNPAATGHEINGPLVVRNRQGSTD